MFKYVFFGNGLVVPCSKYEYVCKTIFFYLAVAINIFSYLWTLVTFSVAATVFSAVSYVLYSNGCIFNALAVSYGFAHESYLEWCLVHFAVGFPLPVLVSKIVDIIYIYVMTLIYSGTSIKIIFWCENLT